MNDDENPTGDAAARCRVYRRQIDDLLRAVKNAAEAIDRPADLLEIRRHLRETPGVDHVPPTARGRTVENLYATVAAISDALAVAAEPHDAATREAATKADHALGFALDDLRRLRGATRPS